MGNILAFCEYGDGALRSSALSNLTFARAAATAHGGEVIIVLIGAGAAAAGAAAAKYAGRVVTVDDPELADVLAETYAPVLARLAGEHGASIISATATSVGKDIMPRVAALLDAGMASDVAKLEAANQFTRPILAGNAYATVEISTPIVCVTVRQSEFKGAEPLGSAGGVTAAPAGELDARGAKIDRVESQKSDRPELTSAKVVVPAVRSRRNTSLIALAPSIGACAVNTTKRPSPEIARLESGKLAPLSSAPSVPPANRHG